ncbi:MAG: putative sugar nucleotidyl transferase [Planctomycetota bacterium]
MQHIFVFEDDRHLQLSPLVYTRTAYELRCGLFTPLERIVSYYPNTTINLYCRDYLADVLREQYPYRVNEPPATDANCLFLNGRAIFPSPIPLEGPEELGMQGETLVYARLRANSTRGISHETFLSKEHVEQLKSACNTTITNDTPVINYFWDIIKLNKSQIEKDFSSTVKSGSLSGNRYEGVHFINRDRIFIDQDCTIKPGCVFDAENGPIYLGKHTTVAPNATIEGPVYIGSHSTVQSIARLRPGANIGDHCKVGGEISNTVFHHYSNKQHDGFLGDSYVGSWVNLGADTVNSNLLNTYRIIKVEWEGRVICTDMMFLGAALGDHTKTAINTTIMTGSMYGFSCNVATSGYPPRYLPSFTWYSDKIRSAYLPEKALQVAKIAMKRRDKEMSPAEEQLFKTTFLRTERERDKSSYGKKL